MGKHNSLQVSSPGAIGNKNSKGRPCANKSVKFSPQPKSMVSQILKKMISENKIVFPIEQNNTDIISSEPIYLSDEDEHLMSPAEIDQTKDSMYKKPKNTFTCKEETKPKTYYCDYSKCSYSTKLSSNLQKHKRVHTGERPYLCDRCSFRTNFSNSLKVHKRLHTEERPYQCNYCDYKCNSVSNLKKHCHTKHKNITGIS